MAESAVKLAATTLGKVLVEEGKYLWGAEDKVAELRNELVWMQRFLKKAESFENKDEIVDQWVLQIKEYVAETEDIVDKFIIQVVSRRRRTYWVAKLGRWICIGKELWTLHQVASSIDSLTLKISKLTPKLNTYGIHPADGWKTYRTTQEALPDHLDQQRMSYAHLEDKKIIGLKQDTQIIVDALLDTKGNRRVVAIYGMGGLGKTTLATKVYNHDEIKKHFAGYCAWAYISKQFHLQTVLQTLLANLTSKSADMFTGKKEETLIRDLKEILQKHRCLVVLDDVWNTNVWNSLKAAFPPDGGESGSKVLLTTRKEDVAKHENSLAYPKPDRLNDTESWDLLKHNLGWVDEDAKKDKEAAESSSEKEVDAGTSRSGEQKSKIGASDTIHGGQKVQDAEGFRLGPNMFGADGPKVKELGMEMVKHCNGIPLAIAVLGGILRKKETLEGWRLVSENITSYLRKGNDHGKSYLEVLVLSYTDLPYHLKPCFLHLGNFPEDYEIPAEKLYRMWVAEGLIACPYDRVSSTESLEDIANEHLSHLAQAGMVQIVNKASNGRIKSVRIHDLMRDVCLQKAATENFFSMIDHRTDPDEPQSLSSSSDHARLLHMAIYLAEDVKNYLPEFIASKAHKYLKSLLFFAGKEVREDLVQQWMKRICKDFPRLRVLGIEGLRLKGRLTKNLQKMKHLRYLSLKGTYISDLPSSISNLMFLQTLDLRVSFSGSPVQIPNTLWKLERLRHLFLPKISYAIKNKSSFLFLNTLSCLETLKNLKIGILRTGDLQKLRKLKKLSIKDDVSDVVIMDTIVRSPAVKSGHLRSCSLCVKGSVIDSNPGILSRFDCLDELKVNGKISRSREYVLPQSLVVLQMESCELGDDSMTILGKLRNLKHLSLGVNSFIGEKMICKGGSFPQLVTLDLQGLTNLEDWILEKESISELKKVSIMDCAKLKRIPDALPGSVQVTCSPCINGIENRGTCSYYGATCSVVDYDKVFIGRDDDTSKLLKLLFDAQSKKVVLSGPSGVGKATLAKRLYSLPEIKEKFDAIAWVRCPHRRVPRSPIRLIDELLRQLGPVKSTQTSIDSSESSGLINVMSGQKCLVILTGLAASLEDLDAIFRTRIPDGSKVLFTTDRSYPKDPNKLVQHNLKALTEEQSLGVFKKILGGALSGAEGDKKVELGKRLLTKLCSGQPHSITLLAGLLAMKKSLTEWENFEDKVIMKEAEWSQLNLYALCYEDLSPHLKDCFLYLANFPENTEISTRKLYNLWIAAGLIILKDDGKKRKESGGEVEKPLENVATSYLNELVLRGMVQVGKRGLDGRIRTCRLQISLRSFCLEKANKKGFRQVELSASASDGKGATGRNQKRELQVPLQSLCFGKQREEHVPKIDQPKPSAKESVEIEHLAVYLNQSDMKIPDEYASVNDQLKSLLFFPEFSDTKDGEYDGQRLINICNLFHFLWVLDLEGMEMIRGALPAGVENLKQLRYLSLKGTQVSELPQTIQNLTRLQTLDLRVVSLTIPAASFTFPNLRHLYLPDSFSVSPSSKLQLSGSTSLQTLVNLHTGNVSLACMSELKNLRRILINNIQEEHELDEKLKSKGATLDLSIRSEILNNNATRLSKFQYLNKVTIKGRISDPLQEGMFPKCLKDLTLKHTQLCSDPIPALQQLPGLIYLCFDHDSFLGENMTFSLGFPRLAHLTLRLLRNLKQLDMTAADHLRHIEPLIIDCWRLEVKLPTGAEIEVGPLVHHPFMGLLLPLRLQGASNLRWLDKLSGKKCWMIAARSLSIIWGDTPKYWIWTSIPESRFPEVAELIHVCWLDISVKIQTSTLSPGTQYAAYLVLRLTDNAHGLKGVSDASVHIDGVEIGTRNVYIGAEYEELEAQGKAITPDQFPKPRTDGWRELKIGEFFTQPGEGDEVELAVKEVKDGNWKEGLIVEGIEVRPAGA